jgi:predicted ribosomally synthesized peptide with SipW-like signal peptide
MPKTYWKRTSSLLIAATLALAGCSGDKGDTGPGGVNTGSITGTITVTGGAPVVGATVATDPLGADHTATTAADGSFTIADMPIGIYSITVSGTGVTQTTFANVANVVAGNTTDIGTKTVAYSPMTITFGTVANPAGFGKAISLSSTVAGATGTVTYAWTQVSGPTAAAFSSTTVANPTFTTGTFEAITTGGSVKVQRVAARPDVINFTAQQQADATYKLRLTVSDGSYSQSKDVSILPAGWVQGSRNVGVGTMVIGNDVAATSYAWTLTPPTGVTAPTLEDATTRNPWFIPTAAGTYTLVNGTTSIPVKVDTYVGVSPTCGTCHPTEAADRVAAIWTEYGSSAHGNFYWNDSTQTPKGIFAGGIDGEVSDHYNSGCPRCHTTGNDATATNGGFDESGFTFPATLAAGNWDALTDAQKRLGTISCESCHGPLAGHNSATNKPAGFFNSEPCGYCHDSGSHHDRYPLWAQGGHANLDLAIEEGTSGSCARCHSAQGFVQWAAAGFPSTFSLTVTWSANEVEPQTCIACHDPHTTRLRIDESAPVVTTSGFTVSGAGAGQLCVTCHTSRRGPHNDGITNTSYSLPHGGKQSDLFFGQNLYFVDVDEINSGATMSTHALVLEGACVKCHMDPALAYEGLNAAPSTTNHSFKVSSNVCGACHEGASFEAVETRTLAQVDALKTSIAEAGKRMLPSAGYKLTGISATIGTTAFTGKATFSSKPDVVTVGLPTGHGTGFTFHWNAPVDVTFLLADNATIPGGADATVTLGDATAGATVGATVSATGITDLSDVAVISAASDLFKAWWNMSLAGEDGSYGGHNPPIVQRVLAISKTRADAVPMAP